MAVDPQLASLLALVGCRAKVERAFVLHLEAFDWNCAQHINPRFTQGRIDAARALLAARTAPIAEIAFQNKALVYAILFAAAAETLRIIAADPRRRDRVGRRPAHLGTEPASSSPCALRRAGWRALC